MDRLFSSCLAFCVCTHLECCNICGGRTSGRDECGSPSWGRETEREGHGKQNPASEYPGWGPASDFFFFFLIPSLMRRLPRTVNVPPPPFVIDRLVFFGAVLCHPWKMHHERQSGSTHPSPQLLLLTFCMSVAFFTFLMFAEQPLIIL